MILQRTHVKIRVHEEGFQWQPDGIQGMAQSSETVVMFDTGAFAQGSQFLYFRQEFI